MKNVKIGNILFLGVFFIFFLYSLKYRPPLCSHKPLGVFIRFTFEGFEALRDVLSAALVKKKANSKYIPLVEILFYTSDNISIYIANSFFASAEPLDPASY